MLAGAEVGLHLRVEAGVHSLAAVVDRKAVDQVVVVDRLVGSTERTPALATP